MAITFQNGRFYLKAPYMGKASFFLSEMSLEFSQTFLAPHLFFEAKNMQALKGFGKA